MPLYSFVCKVCETPKEFAMSIKDAPRVGESAPVTAELVGDTDAACESCGANNWTRIWPSKMGGFKMNMRRTPIL